MSIAMQRADGGQMDGPTLIGALSAGGILLGAITGFLTARSNMIASARKAASDKVEQVIDAQVGLITSLQAEVKAMREALAGEVRIREALQATVERLQNELNKAYDRIKELEAAKRADEATIASLQSQIDEKVNK